MQEELTFAQEAQLAGTVRELAPCNRMSARYGLTLTEEEQVNLARARLRALDHAGRVEFGGSVLPRLIHGFCDSPWLTSEDYALTLEELQELFYHFKNATGDRLSDEELIAALRAVFDGPAHGTVELLADTSPATLARIARGGPVEEAEHGGEE